MGLCRVTFLIFNCSGVFFRVDFDEFPAVTLFSCEFFEDRTEHLAGAAPGCPKIYEDRNLVTAINDSFLKIKHVRNFF